MLEEPPGAMLLHAVAGPLGRQVGKVAMWTLPKKRIRHLDIFSETGQINRQKSYHMACVHRDFLGAVRGQTGRHYC